MKKINIALMAILGLGVISAQATIIVTTTDTTEAATKPYSFTYNSGVVTPGELTTSAVGTLLNAQDGDQFSWTLSGATGWNSTTAAASLADFNTYAAGLTTPANITGLSGKIGGVVGGAAADQIDANEVMFVDFDVSGLSAGSELELITSARGSRGGSAYDWVLVDTGANTVLGSAFNGTANAVDFGSAIIANSSYRLFYAGNSAATGNFQVNDFTVDVIPEPATLGLVAAFGTGILFIRRRLML